MAALGADGRLVHLERLPARAAVARRAGTAPAAGDVRRGARGRAAVVAPGRGDRPRPCRALGRGRHRHRVGQVAVLPGADRRGGHRPGPAGHRAVHLPHQGAGPRPAPGLHRARPARPRRRRLRRRLLDRGAPVGPQARQRRAHQPGDAPLRAAPQPRPLGDVPAAPPLRRRRRAARVPGRVRHPRRPRAAPAPPARRRPRRRPDVHRLLGHHRRARRGWRRRCGARRSRRSPTTARRAASGSSPCGDPLDGASRHRETRPRPARRARRAPGHRAIGFCRSRRLTEVVAADVRRRLPDDLAPTVRPYRGGYLPPSGARSRRSCSRGALRGVVATNALELGVDIGGLDACVLDGFPGTIASFWQQAGRAGRERQQSPRRARRRRRPARPVARAPPHRAVHPAARAGGDQPGQPVRARPPPRLRRLRAAADPRRRAVVARAARRRRARPRARRPAGGATPTRRAGRRRCGPRAGSPSHGVGLRSGSRRRGAASSGPTTARSSAPSTRRGRPSSSTPAPSTSTRACRGGSLDLDLARRARRRRARRAAASGRWPAPTIDIRTGTRRRAAGRSATLELRLGWVEVESRVTGYQRRLVGSGEVARHRDRRPAARAGS